MSLVDMTPTRRRISIRQDPAIITTSSRKISSCRQSDIQRRITQPVVVDIPNSRCQIHSSKHHHHHHHQQHYVTQVSLMIFSLILVLPALYNDTLSNILFGRHLVEAFQITSQQRCTIINNSNYLIQRRTTQILKTTTTTTTSLFAIRKQQQPNRRKSSGSSKKVGKQSKSNNKSNNNSVKKGSQKISKRTSDEPPMMVSTSASSKSARKSSSLSSPPWQVMGTKEMKDNIEREKIRRKLIKDGVVPTHQKLVMAGGNDDDNDDADGTPKLSKTFIDPIYRTFLNWKRFNPTNKIAGQQFIGAFLDPKKLPPSYGVPEIAFLGRSNVGKSSLLNRLTKVSSIVSSAAAIEEARVGKTPGATASVNVYTLVDTKQRNILGWVDLPGFGYAKLSKDMKDTIQGTAENYLSNRKELALGILLVDIRRVEENNFDNDYNVLQALFDMGVPIIVVATKADKITNINEKEKCLAVIRNNLGLPDGQPFCVSSKTGDGIRDLWQIILDACENAVQEANSIYEGSSETARSTFDEDDEYDDEDNYDDDNQVYYNDDDEDDIEYDQGYDWTNPDNTYLELEEEEEDYNLDDNEVAADDNRILNPRKSNDKAPQQQQQQEQRETMKSLRKRVKEMEQRGEI